MTMEMNPAKWRTLDFTPNREARCVLANAGAEDASTIFVFEDASRNRYQWLGELKAEFAQSVAQSIATRMSRIGLNKSEWLRRSER